MLPLRLGGLLLGGLTVVPTARAQRNRPSPVDCDAYARNYARDTGPTVLGGAARGAARGALFGAIIGGGKGARRGAALGASPDRYEVGYARMNDRIGRMTIVWPDASGGKSSDRANHKELVMSTRATICLNIREGEQTQLGA
jgi:hypothetical protein